MAAKTASKGSQAKFPTPDRNRFSAQGEHDKYVAQWAKDNGYSLKPGHGLSIVNQLDYTLGGWSGMPSQGTTRGGGTTYFYGPAGGGGFNIPGDGVKGDGIRGSAPSSSSSSAGGGGGGGGGNDGIKGDGIRGRGVSNDGEFASIVEMLAMQNEAGREEQDRWRQMEIQNANKDRRVAAKMTAKADEQAAKLQELMIQQQGIYEAELAEQRQQNAAATAAALQQRQEASNMARAYVPDLQPTAIAPGVGDGRRVGSSRASSANTLSGLSILTNAGRSAGTLSGLQIA